MVEERDPQNPDQVAFHIVDRWRYVAKLALIEDIYDLGYQLRDGSSQLSEPDHAPADRDETDDRFDLDIYFILVRFMVDQEKMKMNNLKVWQLISE